MLDDSFCGFRILVFSEKKRKKNKNIPESAKDASKLVRSCGLMVAGHHMLSVCLWVFIISSMSSGWRTRLW